MSKATIGTGLCFLGLAATSAFCFPTGPAQEPKGNEKANDTLSGAKEQAVGAVVLAGGGDLPEAARDEFFKLAGGKDKARIVVIPTARAQDTYTGKDDDVLQPWKGLGPASVRLLHTRNRATADDPAFIEPLTKATAVWFTNGHTDRLLNAYQGTKVEAELKRLLERGGVVGGQYAAAAVLADRVIQRFEPEVLRPGYGLLPGILSARGFGQETDKAALDRNPSYVGLGIPNDTGVIVRGRSMQVVGTGPVSVYRAKSPGNPARQDVVPVGAKYDLRKGTVSRSPQ